MNQLSVGDIVNSEGLIGLVIQKDKAGIIVSFHNNQLFRRYNTDGSLLYGAPEPVCKFQSKTEVTTKTTYRAVVKRTGWVTVKRYSSEEEAKADLQDNYAGLAVHTKIEEINPNPLTEGTT